MKNLFYSIALVAFTSSTFAFANETPTATMTKKVAEKVGEFVEQ